MTLESLATLISHTAASADKRFSALVEDIADLKTEMVDRFDHVDKQFGAAHSRARAMLRTQISVPSA